MKIKDIYNKIRYNHGLMMVLCCVVPLLLVIAGVYFFGLNQSYLYWFLILLCPLMHFFMMKDMHKHKCEESNKDVKKD